MAAVQTSPVAECPPEHQLSGAAIARDVATLGSGTLLATVFGVLQVFLIPRLVSVEDFGHWRLFLLYVGYVGIAHLGFADGALLCWAGQPFESFRGETGTALRFLWGQQAVLLLPACILAAVFIPSRLRFVALAVLCFGVIANTVTLLQYSLQAARQFAPVAATTAVPLAVVVAFTFLWSLKAVPSYQVLICLYFLAWSGVMAYLLYRVKPGHAGSESLWGLGGRFIALGWPVVISNTNMGVVQTADRLVVGAFLPIYDFAQYSLAASAMFVPLTAILTVSRVFFPHMAALQAENHRKAYGGASRLLLLAWSLLLPYYFVLSLVVRHWLPKYTPGLPVAAVLLFGVIFLGGIQVLHITFFNLYRRQRRFLALSIAALAASLLLIVPTAIRFRSLTAVAAAQAVSFLLWWALNEWELRHITGQRWDDWLRIAMVFAWSVAVFLLSLRFVPGTVLQIFAYYLVASPPLALAFRNEFRSLGRMFLGQTR